jgi:hypothetical protein
MRLLPVVFVGDGQQAFFQKFSHVTPSVSHNMKGKNYD